MNFREKIYIQLVKVPKGRVTTYKELAKSVGTLAYQAVGGALKNNPDAPTIPCHRVVKTNGEIGGFMGKIDGIEIQKKINLLESEGVEVVDGNVKNFEEVLYRFENNELK